MSADKPNHHFSHSFLPSSTATRFQRTFDNRCRNPLTPLSCSASTSNRQHVPSENPQVKLVIGAGVTLAFEFAVGHFFEFIKIMKQTNPHRSYAQLTKDIIHSKGILGIWDGFVPWGAIQSIAKGSVFSWGHAMTKKTLIPYADEGRISIQAIEVIAGGAGGGFQGLVLSPTLLLKTRVMTDPIFRNRMTALETCKKSLSIGVKVIQNEGVGALMKGSAVFSMKRVADWSTRFFFSVMCEEYLYKRDDPNRKLTNGQKVTASLLGGVLSSISTIPIDVMVAQIQQASKAGTRVSIFGTMQEQLRQGGIRQVAGFATSGLMVRVAHVSLTTVIMKTATSIVYEAYEKV